MATRIIIQGLPKSGKTQLARLIHNMLLQCSMQAFDVVLIDEGKDIINPHRQLLEVTPWDQPARIIIEVKKDKKAIAAAREEAIAAHDRQHLLEEIVDCVKALDPADDEHWTQEGLPAMDAIEAALNDEGISREDVEEAVPGFRRPSRNESPDTGEIATEGEAPAPNGDAIAALEDDLAGDSAVVDDSETKGDG